MNHARRDLCGGCAAMRIPTAIPSIAKTCRQWSSNRNSFLQHEMPGFSFKYVGLHKRSFAQHALRSLSVSASAI